MEKRTFDQRRFLAGAMALFMALLLAVNVSEPVALAKSETFGAEGMIFTPMGNGCYSGVTGKVTTGTFEPGVKGQASSTQNGNSKEASGSGNNWYGNQLSEPEKLLYDALENEPDLTIYSENKPLDVSVIVKSAGSSSGKNVFSDCALNGVSETNLVSGAWAQSEEGRELLQKIYDRTVRAAYAFEMDEPENFWLSGISYEAEFVWTAQENGGHLELTGIRLYLPEAYDGAKSDIAAVNAALDRLDLEISNYIPAGASDEEWIADLYLFSMCQSENYTGSSPSAEQQNYGAVLAGRTNKLATSSALAKLFQVLMRRYGYVCISAGGTYKDAAGHEISRMWNYAKNGGSWYLCDGYLDDNEYDYSLYCMAAYGDKGFAGKVGEEHKFLGWPTENVTEAFTAPKIKGESGANSSTGGSGSSANGWTCSKCGTANSGNFCSNCGNSKEGASTKTSASSRLGMWGEIGGEEVYFEQGEVSTQSRSYRFSLYNMDCGVTVPEFELWIFNGNMKAGTIFDTENDSALINTKLYWYEQDIGFWYDTKNLITNNKAYEYRYSIAACSDWAITIENYDGHYLTGKIVGDFGLDRGEESSYNWNTSINVEFCFTIDETDLEGNEAFEYVQGNSGNSSASSSVYVGTTGGVSSSSGTSSSSTVNEKKICGVCRGTGKCHVCNGTGRVYNDHLNVQGYETCSVCHGDGLCNGGCIDGYR